MIYKYEELIKCQRLSNRIRNVKINSDSYCKPLIVDIMIDIIKTKHLHDWIQYIHLGIYQPSISAY